MKEWPTRVAGFVLAALGATYAWALLEPELRPLLNRPGSPSRTERERHRLTPEREAAARENLQRLAPRFVLPSQSGGSYALEQLLRKGPVLLSFIKEGCPCSESAQAYFNRLWAAYPEAVFVGVFDASPGEAERWAARLQVGYPLLIDRELSLVRAYRVEHSATTVVVAPDGRIEGHWPGYSSAYLHEMGRTLAELLGVPERPLEVESAPELPYTGCPYEIGEISTP